MTYLADELYRVSDMFPDRIPAPLGKTIGKLTRLRSRWQIHRTLLKLPDRQLKDLGMIRNDVVEFPYRRQAAHDACAILYKRSGNW